MNSSFSISKTPVRSPKKLKTEHTRNEQESFPIVIGFFSTSLIHHPTLGLFAVLPIDILYIVIEMLPACTIGSLAQTSTDLRDTVLAWVTGQSFKPKQRKADMDKYVRDVSVILKRATCVIPTRVRISLLLLGLRKIDHWAGKLPTVHRFKGIFIHNFINGWEESECALVYEALQTTLSINEEIKRCSHRRDQMESGRRLRDLLLDHCRSPYVEALWLHKILTTVEDFSQRAELLMILFTPIDSQAGTQDWTWTLHESFRRDFINCQPSFARLARSVAQLILYEHMSVVDCKELLSELFCYPEVWNSQSEAFFLVHLHRLTPEPVIYYLSQQAQQEGLLETSAWTIADMLPAGKIAARFFQDDDDPEEEDKSIFHDVLASVLDNLAPVKRLAFIKAVWDAVCDDVNICLDDPELIARGNGARHRQMLDELRGALELWKQLSIVFSRNLKPKK